MSSVPPPMVRRTSEKDPGASLVIRETLLPGQKPFTFVAFGPKWTMMTCGHKKSGLWLLECCGLWPWRRTGYLWLHESCVIWSHWNVMASGINYSSVTSRKLYPLATHKKNVCDFINTVFSGHNEISRPLVINRLAVTPWMLYHCHTLCYSHLPQ